MSIELVAKLLPVALIAWAHFQIERVGRERDGLWNSLRREPRRWSRGPALLQVRVLSDNDSLVLVGTSLESPEGMSNNAELECAGITVQIVDGPRLVLRRGAKLKASAIVGAERKLVRVITTETGAKQEFTYELAPGRTLWLIGDLPRDLADLESGPFRGDSLGEIDPYFGAYSLSEKPPDKWISGCGAPIAAGLCLPAAVLAAAGSTTAFGVLLSLAAMALLMQGITLPEVPPHLAGGATPATRVRAETVASGDERAREVEPPHESASETLKR